MSRFISLRNRLRRLEPEHEEVEEWPPTKEGNLTTVLYQQLQAEGVELPITLHKGQDGLLLLLELDAPRVWKDYVPA